MISSADIDKKMGSFLSMEDIIDAMKAYAGVTIRKTADRVLDVRAYEKNVLEAMAVLLEHSSRPGFPATSAGGRIIVACGSAQGLCGPFNERIADHISAICSPEDMLFVVGRRLMSILESGKIRSGAFAEAAVSVSGIQGSLQKTVAQIIGTYRTEAYYNLTLVFTAISDGRPENIVEQVLPPDMEKIRTTAGFPEMPLTYMDSRELFDKTLEEYLYISLYRSFLESLRSENWYRLRSMEGAAENLKNRISELYSLSKAARQEEITEEMLEIQASASFREGSFSGSDADKLSA